MTLVARGVVAVSHQEKVKKALEEVTIEIVKRIEGMENSHPYSYGNGYGNGDDNSNGNGQGVSECFLPPSMPQGMKLSNKKRGLLGHCRCISSNFIPSLSTSL